MRPMLIDKLPEYSDLKRRELAESDDVVPVFGLRAVEGGAYERVLARVPLNVLAPYITRHEQAEVPAVAAGEGLRFVQRVIAGEEL